MKTTVNLPAAFSVRDENEFLPMRHVMARMNPKLMVTQVATGMHVNGNCTVLWGVVHKEGQPLTKDDVEIALLDAGFDFSRGGSIQESKLSTGEQKKRRADRRLRAPCLTTQ